MKCCLACCVSSPVLGTPGSATTQQVRIKRGVHILPATDWMLQIRVAWGSVSGVHCPVGLQSVQFLMPQIEMSTALVQVVWLEEIVQTAAAGHLRTGEKNFADRVFENEINSAIQATQQVTLLSSLVPMSQSDLDIHVKAPYKQGSCSCHRPEEHPINRHGADVSTH